MGVVVERNPSSLGPSCNGSDKAATYVETGGGTVMDMEHIMKKIQSQRDRHRGNIFITQE